MTSFFQSLLDRLFGQSEPEEELPDDGGLAEFAKQYAKQLADEAKYGKQDAVRAEDVLHVQQGRHGSRAYLLDTTDFINAIVKELRLSVAPITEGILKTRCGDKGTGYMHVGAFYAFHIPPSNPLDEYNHAITIIDEIGRNLLGDRYLTGEKRINVPVAKIPPQDILNKDGSFNIKKAKKVMKLVRATKTHGPADVNIKKNEVLASEGSPQWQPNKLVKMNKDLGDWQKQELDHPQEEAKEWENITPNEKQDQELGDWETIEHTAPDTEQKDGSPLERTRQEAKTEQSWNVIEPQQPPAPPPTLPKNKKIKSDDTTVRPTSLRQLGTIALAFRPTWDSKQQAINSYAGYIYRQNEGSVFQGDDIYPQDGNEKAIHRIDKAITKQAAQHLKLAGQVDQKHIILPLHLKSLIAKGSRSPLKPLRDLDLAHRRALWVEIVGIDETTSIDEISHALEQHQNSFAKMGLRLNLLALNPFLIQGSQLDFLSCTLGAINIPTLNMGEELARLSVTAKQNKQLLCCWGLRSHTDIEVALRARSRLINGNALAKDIPKPGKVLPLPLKKIMAR